MTKEQKPSSCNSLTSSDSTASTPAGLMSPGVNNLVLRFTQKTLMPLVFDGRCLRRAESENRSGAQPANCSLRIPSKVILTFLAARLNPSSPRTARLKYRRLRKCIGVIVPSGDYSPPERPRQMPARFPAGTILDWRPHHSEQLRRRESRPTAKRSQGSTSIVSGRHAAPPRIQAGSPLGITGCRVRKTWAKARLG